MLSTSKAERIVGLLAPFPGEETLRPQLMFQILMGLSRWHAKAKEEAISITPLRSKLTELGYARVFLRIFCLLIPIKHNYIIFIIIILLQLHRKVRIPELHLAKTFFPKYFSRNKSFSSVIGWGEGDCPWKTVLIHVWGRGWRWRGRGRWLK